MNGMVLRAGFIPLVDAAPLIVALELGYAREEGLDLQLHKAPSWAMLRDMLVLGRIEAAQMLAPVPVAMAMGLGAMVPGLEALSVLSVNGNAICVSGRLAQKMRDSGYEFDFRDAHAAKVALLGASAGPLRLGVPFPFSMHAELMHLWLGEVDLQIKTVPPQMMAQAMAADEVDAFCVGAPWGSIAVETGVGEMLLPSTAIWAFAPEKVLAVRSGWADAEPDLTGRLMRAVWRAGRWLGAAGNRMTASEILSRPEYLNVSAEWLERVLTGRLVISSRGDSREVPHYLEFHAGAASFPWKSQAAWIAARLAARHGLDPVLAAQQASAVFRTDLYRLHLRGPGAELPGASHKLEGAMAHPTAVASETGRLILPPDGFFDGKVFDPDAIG